MLFNFLTIFPEFIHQSLNFGVIGQAIKNQHIKHQVINLRDFALDKHRSVDDKPFGGNDGMLMKPDVLGRALDSIKTTKILFPSPQGPLLTQEKAKQLSQHSEISFLCGRYAGIDARLLVSYEIEEISIGDYVVSGGELPALIIMDAVARYHPGVLGNEISLSADSFSNGLLEAPSFTRPQVWNDLKVPEKLISGDHAKIKSFNEWLSILITIKKRPELLNGQMVILELRKKIQDKAQLIAFYKTLSDDDKKSCGIENMESVIRDF